MDSTVPSCCLTLITSQNSAFLLEHLKVNNIASWTGIDQLKFSGILPERIISVEAIHTPGGNGAAFFNYITNKY